MKILVHCRAVEVLENSREFVASNAMVKNVLSGLFPIAFVYVLLYTFSTLDIIPHMLFGVNVFAINSILNIWYLYLSFYIIFMYALFAEVIFETKSEMQNNVLANLIIWCLGISGFYNVTFPM